MTAYRVAPGVHHREISGEAVVLDTASDRYFGLNPTGAVAWSRITQGGTAEQAAEAVVAAFEVSLDVALADVLDLIRRLTESGLIQPVTE